jgi:hypothetical protein
MLKGANGRLKTLCCHGYIIPAESAFDPSTARGVLFVLCKPSNLHSS